MSYTADGLDIRRTGRPAPVTRLLGWGMLGTLAAFLIVNVMTVGFGFGELSGLWTGNVALATPAAIVYAVCLAAVVFFVLSSGGTALRWDAWRIHRFNVFLIRWAFWAVLLVGLVDTAIAFMRVENIFLMFMDESSARAFGRSRWVGMNVHIPLVGAAFLLACVTRTLGFTWLALAIVAAELLIVITRFGFSYEQAFMGDLVRYWYAALFLFASAYTLFDEGHVRVDVLYAGFKDRTRGFVNAIGSLFLGMSTAWIIIYIGFNGKQSIINSPVMNFEVTQTGSVGMFVKYQMAVFLGIFAITMLIQFVSYFFEAVADYREEPGKRTVAAVAH